MYLIVICVHAIQFGAFLFFNQKERSNKTKPDWFSPDRVVSTHLKLELSFLSRHLFWNRFSSSLVVVLCNNKKRAATLLLSIRGASKGNQNEWFAITALKNCSRPENVTELLAESDTLLRGEAEKRGHPTGIFNTEKYFKFESYFSFSKIVFSWAFQRDHSWSRIYVLLLGIWRTLSRDLIIQCSGYCWALTRLYWPRGTETLSSAPFRSSLFGLMNCLLQLLWQLVQQLTTNNWELTTDNGQFVHPRSTKELWELVSKVAVRSRPNWNLEMLVF